MISISGQINNNMRNINNFIFEKNINMIEFNWSESNPQIFRSIISKYNPKLITPTKRELTTEFSKYINNLISWKKFSDRSFAICATTNDKYKYSRYNYVIVPTIDEIFVCPDFDFAFTSSFPFYTNIISNELPKTREYLSQTLRNLIEELEKFDSENILSILGIKNKSNIFININKLFFLSNKDFNLFLTLLKKSKKTKKLLKLISSENIEDGNTLMSNLLDPIKNGFRKMKYTDFINEIKETKKIHEVWFECECLLIPTDDKMFDNRFIRSKNY